MKYYICYIDHPDDCFILFKSQKHYYFSTFEEKRNSYYEFSSYEEAFKFVNDNEESFNFYGFEFLKILSEQEILIIKTIS